MEYIHINKLLTTSIYKQIAESISMAIEKGTLSYNDKLPTEKEICQAFSISQTAVKMAYEELIKEKKIVRIKGKGTYVTNRALFHTTLHNFYELDLLQEKVLDHYKQNIVLFERKLKDVSIHRELNLKKSETIYRIVRVIRSDVNPVLLQEVYLPKRYFKDFEQNYKTFNNLFTFIEDQHGYEIDHLHSTFSAINASASEALLLNLEPDDALTYVRTRILDKAGKDIVYIMNYFPGDFTEFEVIVHAI